MNRNKEFCKKIKFKPNSYTKENLLDLNNRQVTTAVIANQIIDKQLKTYEDYKEKLLQKREEYSQALTMIEEKIKETKEFLLKNKQTLTKYKINELAQNIIEAKKSKEELEEFIMKIDEKIEEIEDSELQIVYTVAEAANEQSCYSLNDGSEH